MRAGAADRSLTPGAVDPTATREVVCQSGYATKARPNRWVALKLKAKAMKLYGLSLLPYSWHTHTLDHLVPLELGGHPTDIRNLWPQTKPSARLKDVDENHYHRLVCAGVTTLADAQQYFIDHWSS